MFDRILNIVGLSLCLCFNTTICNAAIDSAASAVIALETLETSASDIQNKAENTGDYLAGKVAIESLKVIDELRRAYRDELNKTLQEIDTVISQKIRSVEGVLQSANNGLNKKFEEASTLENRLAQIMADTLIGEDGPYITEVKPNILFPKLPSEQDFYLLKITGVDLHDIEVTTPEGNKESAIINRIDNTALLLHIPSSWIIPSDHGLAILEVEIKLFGDRRFWIGPRKRVDSTLTIGILPHKMGTLTYNGLSTTSRRIERKISRNPGQFKAKNETVRKWVKPTEGWKIDIAKPIKVSQSGADKGRCQGYSENDLSSNGILLIARLDKIKGKPFKYPSGAPGKVSCTATFTEYRIVPAMSSFGEQVDLSWTKGDIIELPNNFANANFRVSLFDGSEVASTGELIHEFFKLQRDGNRVVFTPTPPDRL